MASLPPELIREILLKASVETLLRCKSVCKEWYSLISFDNHFIKTYYTLSCTNIRLVSFEQTTTLKVSSLSNLMFPKSANDATLLENPLRRSGPHAIMIAGSCNGLMCLFVDHYFCCELYVYNPSTRKLWGGLSSGKRIGERKWYSFGYDESTDDFKIVEFAQMYDSHVDAIDAAPATHIYSLKTGTWTNIGDFPNECLSPEDGCGVFLNGALHWVVVYDDDSLDEDDFIETPRIVSLDLAKETYGEVVLFEYDEAETKLLTLGVLGGCLCGLFYYGESRADLWVMKVYGVKDSWTKMASFPYLSNDWISESPVPLFISIDRRVLFHCYKGLVIYDLRDSSVSLIEDFRYDDALIVAESLVSPLTLVDNNDKKG